MTARLSRRAATLVALLGLTTPLVSQQAVPSAVPPRATTPAAAASPTLPPLTPDAERLVDQWKQEQASIIDQLRFLQQTYRDAGRAEDAAAIAAQVRVLQQRLPPVSGTATADLVNEGLPFRDEPVVMSLFRTRNGETLSFAIRGRDDLPVWGTAVYTDDSALETAAVHSGLLRVGQSGIVKVTILPGLEQYQGTVQNGVRSIDRGRHEGSYRLTGASITTPSRTTSLTSYRDLVGLSIVLPVVGVVSGTLYGSDVYSDDSLPALAAVHAGIIAPGEFAFVKVTILPGQRHYDGSMRNGVTSRPYEQWPGSFRVDRAPEPWIVQLPNGEDASRLVPMNTLRGRTGTSFIVQVVGLANGPVWGTGFYTDDTSIAAAAVHAGLLKAGELGFVRVTMSGARESYTASESNGIKSGAYGPWEGSFRLDRVAR